MTDASITIIGPVATFVKYETSSPDIPENTEKSMEKK